MRFPKTLDILLLANLIRNATKLGEVTAADCEDLEIIDNLSQELGFSYKVYSQQFHVNGDLFVGHFVLNERLYNWSTYPYHIEDTTFAVSKTHTVSNSLGFLSAFTLQVWVALFLSIVLMTFTLYLISRGRVPFSTLLFYISVTLVGKHRDWKPKSRAQKWVVFIWSVAITFLTLAYAAVLLSFLTVPSREKGITNFIELHNAIKKGKASALKFKEDSVDKMLIQSGSKQLKFFGEHIREQNTVTEGNKGNFLDVIKPNVAVFGPRFLLEKHYGGDDHFISTDSILILMRVIYQVTENGFCCVDKVNTAIHRIWDAGLFKKKRDEKAFRWKLYYRSIFPNMYSRDENTIRPLSLCDMSGAFYLLLMGQILGSMCLICEIVIHRNNCKVQAIRNYMH